MSDPNQPATPDPAEQPATPPQPEQPVPPYTPPAQYPAAPPAGPGYGAPQYPAQYPGQYPPAQYPTPTYPAAAPPYGAYAAGPRTNALAIVSFVSSLVGVILIPLIGQIVGVITGHIALGQLKKSGESGRGFALAGVIIGWVSLGLCVVAIILIFAVFLPLAIMQGTHGYSS